MKSSVHCPKTAARSGPGWLVTGNPFGFKYPNDELTDIMERDDAGKCYLPLLQVMEYTNVGHGEFTR